MRGTWYNSWGMRPNKLNTMQIILKHMNTEEAWQYILQLYNMYQSRLKKFNYSPIGKKRQRGPLNSMWGD